MRVDRYCFSIMTLIVQFVVQFSHSDQQQVNVLTQLQHMHLYTSYRAQKPAVDCYCDLKHAHHVAACI